MKVSGTATLNAPRDKVWAALNDPAVLVRTIPGCQRLEEIGEDSYRMTLMAGVASIKGVYQGEVRLTEQQPHDTFVLKAAGSGAPGTVSADVLVRLTADTDETTTLTYDADAIVGGMIGGVGQRMLSGVAKKTAGEFFSAVDDVLCGRAATPASVTSVASAGAGDESGAQVFESPGAAGVAAGNSQEFVKGAVFGAGVALLGVLVGASVTGRRKGH